MQQQNPGGGPTPASANAAADPQQTIVPSGIVGGPVDDPANQAALMDKFYSVGDGLEGLAGKFEGLAGKFKTSELVADSVVGADHHVTQTAKVNELGGATQPQPDS